MNAYNQISELYAEGPYHQAFPFREGALRLGKEGFDPDHPWQSDDCFAIR